MIWNEEIWIRSLWKFLKELTIYRFKIKGNPLKGSSFIGYKFVKLEKIRGFDLSSKHLYYIRSV